MPYRDRLLGAISFELKYDRTDLDRAKAILSAYAALLREVVLISAPNVLITAPNLKSLFENIAYAIIKLLRRRADK